MSTANGKVLEFFTKISRLEANKAIIRQVMASSILDSLFLEVRKKETAIGMWEAVKDQREKEFQMVTVDMHHKLQAEKCLKSGDVQTPK